MARSFNAPRILRGNARQRYAPERMRRFRELQVYRMDPAHTLPQHINVMKNKIKYLKRLGLYMDHESEKRIWKNSLSPYWTTIFEDTRRVLGESKIVEVYLDSMIARWKKECQQILRKTFFLSMNPSLRGIRHTYRRPPANAWVRCVPRDRLTYSLLKIFDPSRQLQKSYSFRRDMG